MMHIDIAAGFRYSTLDLSQHAVYLETNLDVNAVGLIDVYKVTGFALMATALKLPGTQEIKLAKADIFNLPAKYVARLFDIDGVWWADDFIVQDGVLNIEFQSQGEGSGSGDFKSFSGSIRVDNRPAVRNVYALAIDGDVPKLIASTVSDGLGKYQLQWQGYVGQILVTATDDYGDDFEASAVVSIGDRIHPVAPNGYVYEVSGAGQLGATSPAFIAGAGETIISGDVQLIAVPFYKPQSNGPFLIT